MAQYGAVLGSPPRMRGKALDAISGVLADGITPAYAGKSTHRPSRSALARDHPRVCGEKCVMRIKTFPLQGSPPRMRGKVIHVSHSDLPFGITPAYAGKSAFSRTTTWRAWDHPRVCGEKFHLSRHFLEVQGSPPRMRGKDSESLEIQVLLFSSAHFSFNF